MSKLKEMIDRLCPNGVPVKPLWELTIWDKKFNGVDRAKQPRVISYPYLLAKDMKALEQDHGDVTLLSTGEYVGYTTEELAGEYLCEGEVVTIPWGGTVKGMKYFKGKFVTADNRIATSSDTSILNNKFLYYIFLKQADVIQSFYRGAGIQHPNMNDLLHMLIPVPPIEIQEEIVRILDRFTEYAAELQAELQARKEQYEYYRNLLLGFNPSAYGCGTEAEQEKGVNTPPSKSYKTEWKTMGEICEIKGRIGFRGYTRKDIVPKGQGAISLSPSNIKDGSLYLVDSTYISWAKYYESPEIMVENGDIILAKTASVGKVTLVRNVTESATINPQMVVLKKISCNPLYLSFVLNGSYFQTEIKKVTGIGSVPNVPQSALAKIRIPIPPMEVQERIVAILDRFESLVNDLSKGLPAEIAAVKERYEYYRNRLLTFDKTA